MALGTYPAFPTHCLPGRDSMGSACVPRSCPARGFQGLCRAAGSPPRAGDAKGQHDSTPISQRHKLGFQKAVWCLPSCQRDSGIQQNPHPWPGVSLPISTELDMGPACWSPRPPVGRGWGGSAGCHHRCAAQGHRLWRRGRLRPPSHLLHSAGHSLTWPFLKR